MCICPCCMPPRGPILPPVCCGIIPRCCICETQEPEGVRPHGQTRGARTANERQRHKRQHSKAQHRRGNTKGRRKILYVRNLVKTPTRGSRRAINAPSQHQTKHNRVHTLVLHCYTLFSYQICSHCGRAGVAAAAAGSVVACSGTEGRAVPSAACRQPSFPEANPTERQPREMRWMDGSKKTQAGITMRACKHTRE